MSKRALEAEYPSRRGKKRKVTAFSSKETKETIGRAVEPLKVIVLCDAYMSDLVDTPLNLLRMLEDRGLLGDFISEFVGEGVEEERKAAYLASWQDFLLNLDLRQLVLPGTLRGIEKLIRLLTDQDVPYQIEAVVDPGYYCTPERCLRRNILSVPFGSEEARRLIHELKLENRFDLAVGVHCPNAFCSDQAWTHPEGFRQLHDILSTDSSLGVYAEVSRDDVVDAKAKICLPPDSPTPPGPSRTLGALRDAGVFDRIMNQEKIGLALDELRGIHVVRKRK